MEKVLNMTKKHWKLLSRIRGLPNTFNKEIQDLSQPSFRSSLPKSSMYC